MHLTLVPYIAAAGELKTKPTQHSVRELMEIGIQPDILICRTERPLVRRRQAQDRALLQRRVRRASSRAATCRSIYEIPLRFHEQGLDERVLQRLGLETPAPDLSDVARAWSQRDPRAARPRAHRRRRQVHRLRRQLQERAGSAHPRRHRQRRRRRHRLALERPLHRSATRAQRDARAVSTGCWCPAASACAASKAWSRRFAAARENGAAVLRHLPRHADRDHRVRAQRAAASTTATRASSRRSATTPVISLMESQQHVTDMGGTMRLGAYPCRLARGIARGRGVRRRRGQRAAPPSLRGLQRVSRRVRRARPAARAACRPTVSSSRSSSCPTIRGSSAASSIPELQSRPTRPHPLFAGFIARRGRAPKRAQRAERRDRTLVEAARLMRWRASARCALPDRRPVRARGRRAQPARRASSWRGSRERVPGGIIFKASFDKANRSNAGAPRGPGLDEGLAALERVRRRDRACRCSPTCTCRSSARRPREVVDVLQIPAFLCRQTDLLVAAGATGKPVNVKKGQWMHPEGMRGAVEKVARSRAAGHAAIGRRRVTERGTFFGYGDLVVDMRTFARMREAMRRAGDLRRDAQRAAAGARGGRRERRRARVHPAAHAGGGGRRRRRVFPRDASRSRRTRRATAATCAAGPSSSALIARALARLARRRERGVIDSGARARAFGSSASTSTACSPTAASTSATSAASASSSSATTSRTASASRCCSRPGIRGRADHRARVRERRALRAQRAQDRRRRRRTRTRTSSPALDATARASTASRWTRSRSSATTSPTCRCCGGSDCRSRSPTRSAEVKALRQLRSRAPAGAARCASSPSCCSGARRVGRGVERYSRAIARSRA